VLRPPEPRKKLRHRSLDAGLVVGLHVERAKRRQTFLGAEPLRK
jgi:hypothetical protein